MPVKITKNKNQRFAQETGLQFMNLHLQSYKLV
jgi:hypothetical protein